MNQQTLSRQMIGLALVAVFLAMCVPQATVAIVGLWSEPSGRATLEFTDSGDYILNFDPPLLGTYRFEGKYKRIDYNHLKLQMFHDGITIDGITIVEAAVNSDNMMQFSLDGKIYEFIKEEPKDRPHLEFTWDDYSCDLGSEASSKGILSSVWISEDTLRVEGMIERWSDGTMAGDYSVEGDNLFLICEERFYWRVREDKQEDGTVSYNRSPSMFAWADCGIPYKVVWEISGLEQKDYAISMTDRRHDVYLIDSEPSW